MALKKNEIFERKKTIAGLYKNRCYVCRRKFGKGFLIHHKWYYQNGAVYSDENYHERIYDEVRANPDQFLLLCTKCHYALEKLKRYKKDKLGRLIRAVRMSR